MSRSELLLTSSEQARCEPHPRLSQKEWRLRNIDVMVIYITGATSIRQGRGDYASFPNRQGEPRTSLGPRVDGWVFGRCSSYDSTKEDGGTVPCVHCRSRGDLMLRRDSARSFALIRARLTSRVRLNYHLRAIRRGERSTTRYSRCRSGCVLYHRIPRREQRSKSRPSTVTFVA